VIKSAFQIVSIPADPVDPVKNYRGRRATKGTPEKLVALRENAMFSPFGVLVPGNLPRRQLSIPPWTHMAQNLLWQVHVAVAEISQKTKQFPRYRQKSAKIAGRPTNER
jgi:hypothetical protein